MEQFFELSSEKQEALIEEPIFNLLKKGKITYSQLQSMPNYMVKKLKNDAEFCLKMQDNPGEILTPLRTYSQFRSPKAIERSIQNLQYKSSL